MPNPVRPFPGLSPSLPDFGPITQPLWFCFQTWENRESHSLLPRALTPPSGAWALALSPEADPSPAPSVSSPRPCFKQDPRQAPDEIPHLGFVRKIRGITTRPAPDVLILVPSPPSSPPPSPADAISEAYFKAVRFLRFLHPHCPHQNPPGLALGFFPAGPPREVLLADGAGEVVWAREGCRRISTFSTQFCCEPK